MLELDAVTKRFGGLTAVREISLRAAPGEIVGIIGPNGAGKTTLFNVISGFFAPDSGRVLLDGRDVSRVPAHKICALGLCRTFQIVKPFGNLSVEDNVMIGGLTRLTSVAAARDEARRVIALCRLEPYAASPARSLPIGLRKRLEVARALATRPRLLLLDEVMAGLNATEIGEMIALIRALHAEGLGVIIIEHIMAAMMRLAQRIVVLHHGEKIAEGPPESIARDPRVVDAYLGEEFVLADA
jgi:branched-chain amino acid transport system ATP-binding protein